MFHKSSTQDEPQTPEAREDGTISKTATWIEAAAGTVHGPSYSPLFEDDSAALQNPPAKDWTKRSEPGFNGSPCSPKLLRYRHVIAE